MNLVLAGCAIAFFSVLAFWKLDTLLFMLTAGASVMTGLYWRDTYTTNWGLTMGLMLIAYSIVCLGFALGCLFKRGKTSEE